MSDREITLWIDDRWYDALSRRLKDETVEDKLNSYLDALVNQLPVQEYERICREISQEVYQEVCQEMQRTKEGQEAARKPRRTCWPAPATSSRYRCSGRRRPRPRRKNRTRSVNGNEQQRDHPMDR